MITGVHSIIYSKDSMADLGWGQLTELILPGCGKLGVYQPWIQTIY